MICTSTGNQGAAIGYACSKLNIKLTLVIPKSISNIKLKHIKRYISSDTKLIYYGIEMDEAE